MTEIGNSAKRSIWTYKMGKEEIVQVHEEKDLRVIIQDCLEPNKYVVKIFMDIYKKVTNNRCIPPHGQEHNKGDNDCNDETKNAVCC